MFLVATNERWSMNWSVCERSRFACVLATVEVVEVVVEEAGRLPSSLYIRGSIGDEERPSDT